MTATKEIVKTFSLDIEETDSKRFDRSEWDLTEAVLPYCRRALLWGPPGTGKTYAGIYGVPPNTNVFTVTLSEDMPVAELRGHYLRGADGQYHWHDGIAIRAWRAAGGRLVLNEINRTSDDIRTFLYAILDDLESAEITLPSGETVRPDPRFTVVATMNGSPDELPEALQDRFTTTVHVKNVHPNALLRLPKQLQPIARRTTAPDATKRVSIRAWLDFCTLLTNGCNPYAAGAAVFGERWKELRSDIKVAMTSA